MQILQVTINKVLFSNRCQQKEEEKNVRTVI